MLQYLLKFSISLAVLYIFYRAVLRPLTFYQCNRFYLLCYSLLSFAIPFINITPWVVKENNSDTQLVNIIPLIGNYTVAAANKTVAEQSSFWQNITWSQWLLIIFSIGSVFALARIVYQYLSLMQIRRKAFLISKDDNIHLYRTNAPVGPFSFGNSIYFNHTLHTEEELQRIIQHEFVHVKQKHSIDILVAELLCVVNWFNPFAWFIRHAIRQNLEFIADNDVLKKGLNKKEYQYLLLKVVGIPQYSIANNFNFSSLKKRIIMMNKMKSAKAHLAKFLFVLPVMAVLLLAFRNSKNNDTEKSTRLQRANTNAVFADTVPPPPPPPPPPATASIPEPGVVAPELPDNVSGINISSNIDKRKGTNTHTAVVTLKNGTKEKYNLNDPNEKAAYIKKYGEFSKPADPFEPAQSTHEAINEPLIAPVPDVNTDIDINVAPNNTATGTNRDNVAGTSIHNETNKEKGINIQTAVVTLKNGTKEKYDLTDPKQKADYINKYGELPKSVPPVPPVPAGLAPEEKIMIDVSPRIEPVQPAEPPLPPVSVSFSFDQFTAEGIITNGNESDITGSFSFDCTTQMPLIVVDGIKKPGLTKYNAAKGKYGMVTLNAKEGIAKYGDAGKNGVIEITNKSEKQPKPSVETVDIKADTIVWNKGQLKIIGGNITINGQESIINGGFVFNYTEDIKEMPLVVYNGKVLENMHHSLKISNASYRLYSLNAKQSLAKYGDKGKFGALEINSL